MSNVSDYLVPVDACKWVADFSRAVETRDSALFRSLFAGDTAWRDQMSFTWDIKQVWGLDAVEAQLWSVVDAICPTNFQIDTRWHRPGEIIFSGQKMFELMLSFQTNAAENLAVITGQVDATAPYGFVVDTLYTRMESLRDFPMVEQYKDWHGYEPEHQGQNWAEYRASRLKYEDREPEVLIVGGGHNGMVIGAYLNMLGVDNLIIEKDARAGDNWRRRYHNLNLHNSTHMNQLPFLKTPDLFPRYMPKDKFADWLETYAQALDLNMWLSTQFTHGSYDESAGHWITRVTKQHGSERVLRPKHLVLATGGLGSLPNIPDLPGIKDFAGETMHSSQFRSAEDFAGKNAIIVGIATSAHDIAADLADFNADVTMLQRGPLIVTNLDSANMVYPDYTLGYDADLVDTRMAAAAILPRVEVSMRAYAKMVTDRDRPLLDALRAVGMELYDGPDHLGWVVQGNRTGGGYYLNVGTSERVASGEIKVSQYRDIDKFVPEGVRFNDGSVLPADVVVLATGYENRAAELKHLLDESIAERFDQIGLMDDSGEMANAFVETVQPGLWFGFHGFQPTRMNAGQMAMRIKATMEGLVPAQFRKAKLLASEED